MVMINKRLHCLNTTLANFQGKKINVSCRTETTFKSMFVITRFCVVIMYSLPSAEHQPSPVAEMGDTLEFNEIYQEVKGSWVSIPWVNTHIHIFVKYEGKKTHHITKITSYFKFCITGRKQVWPKFIILTLSI